MTVTAERTSHAAATLDAQATSELEGALARLDRGRGIVLRMADLVGGAVNIASRFGLRRLGLEGMANAGFNGIAEAALSRAYNIAIIGLPDAPTTRANASRAAVIGSGAVSGFVGLAGFLPDATFTTLAIMREVARIARLEGEDLATDDARRAILEVFALRSSQDESELGYFSARMALQGGTLGRLITDIAARYGTVLGEKLSLQAVPIAGAVAGAVLNAAFLEHYRNLAIGHFTIRRLERSHGRQIVQNALAAMNPLRDVSFNAA